MVFVMPFVDQDLIRNGGWELFAKLVPLRPLGGTSVVGVDELGRVPDFGPELEHLSLILLAVPGRRHLASVLLYPSSLLEESVVHLLYAESPRVSLLLVELPVLADHRAALKGDREA